MVDYSENLNDALFYAKLYAEKFRNQFVTPEHVLLLLIQNEFFQKAIVCAGAYFGDVAQALDDKINKMEVVPRNIDYEVEYSEQLTQCLESAGQYAEDELADCIDCKHFMKALLELPDSWAAYLVLSNISCPKEELLGYVEEAEWENPEDEEQPQDDDFTEVKKLDGEERSNAEHSQKKDGGDAWRKLVTCVNDVVDTHNPLIGRQNELERTVQVLCRKDKNNPLHVGEPGVGKTSIVYGLARRINDGDVPPRLQGAKIYSLDLSSLLAGTQFRGDLEKRVKEIMDGVASDKCPIVYIDEIHNLVGAGQISGGSMDASNMLKPYLESGAIRFIGSTTYKEYNKYFAQSQGMVRRFQMIDILEPSQTETVKILEGLRQKYEEFHGITYAEGVLEYAVEMSAKYINDRFLPDKAIDLMDESGAYRQIHRLEQDPQIVDKQLISDVLAKICKIDASTFKEDENENLENLSERISSQIYGQPEAVKQVVEAVQMGKAGLLDDDKPVASLLFVGPTGVGKTEVTRVLATELGLPLVRFDMSEYAEKHTVAKLIGSPAGYVGYEDGGLLTDAIRKTPNCVLLLDEIEKAHADIYNILLQVMDYAKLTDNRGQKADFRHVILIMTSNAGAQYASQASVGFNSQVSAGDAMLTQVKKTFKPEFLNRLSATVVFHDMDQTMASMVIDKKLRQLTDRLSSRNVSFTLSDDARQFLLLKGFSVKYGAREMDRVIRQNLNPLLMREILFGGLKNGGKAEVTLSGDNLDLKVL